MVLFTGYVASRSRSHHRTLTPLSQDFKPANVLINCYHSSEFCYDFRPFFTTKQARFVLCDFNLSVMFPSDTPLANRLLPVSESEWGSPEYHPPDVANGETVYDPFAYDVACLGGVLCATIGVRPLYICIQHVWLTLPTSPKHSILPLSHLSSHLFSIA